MISTIPNIEIVRRISILNGASSCYIVIDCKVAFIQVLADINTETLIYYKEELESWCGMKFQVYNELDDAKTIRSIKKKWEQNITHSILI